MGAERGVNYEQLQALVTNIFQRQWEWQEDRQTDLQPGLYRYNTAFVVSLDMKDGIRRGQAFSGIEDTHLDRRTPDGCFADRNAGRSGVRVLRYSRCLRQGGVEAPVLWGRVAKYELWKAEEKLESQRLEVTLRRTTRQ